jgi:hypothetical protein
MKVFANILLLGLAALFGNNKNIKESKTILYVLPDAVEVSVNKYMHQLYPKQETLDFYFLLENKGTDICAITAIRYEKDKQTTISKWIEGTDRSVLIDRKNYPLLLDSDFRFGSLREDNIGVMGKRDGFVTRVLAINESCFTIVFRHSTGKVIKTP